MSQRGVEIDREGKIERIKWERGERIERGYKEERERRGRR